MKRQPQKSAIPAARKAAPATPKSAAPNRKSKPKQTASKAKPATAAAKPAATTRATKPAVKSAASSSGMKQHTTPDLYSSIHALLHTMRLIEQHEESLCSMHDELKRTGKLSAAHHRKLHQLVHELPTDDYQADLETLRYALAAQNL